MPPSTATLEEIVLKQPVWRGGALARSAARTVPTGFAALDRELPGGGWPGGALTELFGLQQGVGELQLVIPALAALSTAGRRIVWLAPPHLPYAPALRAAGVDLHYLTVVRAPGRRDTLWAAEQVLRGGACHALVAWLRDASYGEMRRLALAAEASPAFVALFRPREAVQASSPACLRLMLAPDRNGLAVHVLKRRGLPLASPLSIPVKRPVNALGGTSFPLPLPRSTAARPCSV